MSEYPPELSTEIHDDHSRVQPGGRVAGFAVLTVRSGIKFIHEPTDDLPPPAGAEPKPIDMSQFHDKDV